VMKGIWSGLVSLFAVLALTAGASAEEHDGYIICLKPQVALLSERQVLPDGMEEIYAARNLYKTTDEALIAELEETGLLLYAEPDYPVRLMEEPNDPAWVDGTQWDLSVVDMSFAWERGITGALPDGEPVLIGVLDSGLYASHEDLEGAGIVSGVNLCAEEGTAARQDTTDAVGHGTFITGIISAVAGNGRGMAGMAPGAAVMPLKCFTRTTGYISDIVEGIYTGVDAGCRILNLSFGVGEDWADQTLADAVAYAAQNGVIMVAAAGNIPSGSSGNDPLLYPAAYDSVIGVGAVNGSGDITRFSCQNESVYVTAPGDSLYSLSSKSAAGYRRDSGTSFATAEVTSAAALALSVDPDLTPEEFMALLRQSVTDRGEEGYDTVYGYGMLNVSRLLELLHSGCYVSDSEEGTVAVIRSENLVPGSSVQVIRAVHDENGAQVELQVIPWTVAEDGTLKGRVSLREAGGVISLLLLDEASCPLMGRWSHVPDMKAGETAEEP